MPDTPSDAARRWLFAAAALWLLVGALLYPARAHGDGGEYHLMTESLLRHLGPDVRAADVQSLATHDRRFHARINFSSLPLGYFEAQNGRWYSYHFWGYSLLTVPARALLRLLGGNDLKSAQLTNALVFVFALHQALFAAALPGRAASALMLLALFSPAVWFVLWTHPEAFCFALVLLALVWLRAGRRQLPILCVALAAMQNPPLVFLLLPLWLRGCLVPTRLRLDPRGLVRASLCALPVVFPSLFFYARFGTPSLIARESASASLVSLRRALELFFDLNIGLLPYAPVVLVLFIAGTALALASAPRARSAWGSAAVLVAMALASSATGNWNHGTAGPSRYTIWMLPLLLMVVAETYAQALERGGRRARVWTALVALAVVVQAVIVLGRGGLSQESDNLTHSAAARFALRHAPAWYNPSPSIFVARSRHSLAAAEDEPVIYSDERGCRKAWVRPDDTALVHATCGRLPPAYESFFKSDQRGQFGYVDFE